MTMAEELYRCPRISRDIRTGNLIPRGEPVLSHAPWNGEILTEFQLLQMGIPFDKEELKESVLGELFCEVGFCQTPETASDDQLADLEERERQRAERLAAKHEQDRQPDAPSR